MEINAKSAADAVSSIKSCFMKWFLKFMKGNLKQIQKIPRNKNWTDKTIKLKIIGFLQSVLAVLHFATSLSLAATKIFPIFLTNVHDIVFPYISTFMGFYPYFIAPPLNPPGTSLDTTMTKCISFDFKFETYFGLEIIQKALGQSKMGYQDYYCINQ